MQVPVKNSAQKDAILAAASQLFARQGYHGTSTREIARLADVSENTIFRHFDRKEDLFLVCPTVSLFRHQAAAGPGLRDE